MPPGPPIIAPARKDYVRVFTSMKLSPRQIARAIREQSELLKASELAFCGHLFDVNPDELMDEVFQVRSVLLELKVLLNRSVAEIKVDFNGEVYSLEELSLWCVSLRDMAGLWLSVDLPMSSARWSQLCNLLMSMRLAGYSAEHSPHELGEIDPILFKGTSIQPEVDAQVL